MEVQNDELAGLPELPTRLGAIQTEELEGDVALCPIRNESCALEKCAWFNPKTGYCFVTYLCLKF